MEYNRNTTRILIVGSGIHTGRVARECLEAIAENDIKALVMIPQAVDYLFEINGKRYVERESDQIRYPRFSSPYARMVMDMALHSAQSKPNGRPPANCDLRKEFGLIERKESRLSASERQWVVWKFNKLYKELE